MKSLHNSGIHLNKHIVPCTVLCSHVHAGRNANTLLYISRDTSGKSKRE